MKISFEGTELCIDGKALQTPMSIKEAFRSLDGVIVLMDPFSGLTGPTRSIQNIRNSPNGTNLFCYSSTGALIWKAELPGVNDAQDYFYRIVSHAPLIVNSFTSYRCEIDQVSGKIMRKEFLR